jgi:adenylate cyclase
MERRLAAILNAVVVGNNRALVSGATDATRPGIAYRKIMEALIEQHHGDVVPVSDGAFLVTFPSVVEALQCALVIQSTLLMENASRAPTERTLVRMGIHLGDVIVQAPQIYGQGVTIATRLQELAAPGGICLSAAVYEQIKGRVAVECDDIGAQKVKNHPEPVRAYQIPVKHGTPTAPPRVRTRILPSWLPLWGIAGGVVVLFLSLVLVSKNQSWRFLRSKPTALGALPSAETPTLAVLPFLNMSNSPEQDYFSDGMTEDLITDLSQISGLFVIARNSVFPYKGKSVKVQDIGRELGVRYVLEGSVRKNTDAVRITAQLIDASTGYHVWSERYERPLSDIFALEDDVRQKIVTALKVKLTREEQERLQRAPTNNLEAYDYYLRALGHAARATEESPQQMREMLKHALALDPQYAAASALLGATYLWEWVNQQSEDLHILDQAAAFAQQAVSLNEALPLAQRLMSGVYLWKDKDYTRAITAGERALTLDPNDADSYVELAGLLSYVGRTTEAVTLLQKAMRLNPQYPSRYLFALGHIYHAAWKNDEALTVLQRFVAQNPDALVARVDLACTYSELGQEEEARTQVAEILRLKPDFSLRRWQQRSAWADPHELAHHMENLRRLGLR